MNESWNEVGVEAAALRQEIAELKRKLARAQDPVTICTALVERSASDRGRAHRVLERMPGFVRVEVDKRRSIFIANACDLDELHVRLCCAKALPVVALTLNSVYVVGHIDGLFAFDLEDEPEGEPLELTADE